MQASSAAGLPWLPADFPESFAVESAPTQGCPYLEVPGTKPQEMPDDAPPDTPPARPLELPPVPGPTEILLPRLCSSTLNSVAMYKVVERAPFVRDLGLRPFCRALTYP